MCEELDNIDWDDLLQHDSIETNWDLFKNLMLSLLDKYVPKVVKKVNTNKPPWWSSRLSKAVRDKQYLYSHFKFTKSPLDYSKYTSQRNHVKYLIRSAKVKHDELMMQRFKSNPKMLYSYVRSKSKVRSRIGQLEKSDGTLTTNDKETAGVLSSFFKSVFTVEDTSAVPNFPTKVNTTLNDISFTESDLYSVLKSLNPNKTPGPDNVHPQLLKNCAHSLTKPLFLLFVQSLNSGKLPKEWKMANVTPIFKKGSKTSASNYRPVSLTSQVVKILESLIRSRIMQYLEDNNIVTHCQHGFVTKKSCFTNLLETYENWTLALDSGHGIDVIYLDYRKAFDSVPHCRLAQRLAGYGLDGKILTWLTDFLSDRLQRVALNGEVSEWLEVTSGVPQGSVLGPLLFVLYINDIAEAIQCDLEVFADDTKLYSIIETIEDILRLQQDLNSAQEWSTLSLLSLNIDKCKVMHIGNTLASNYYVSDSASLTNLSVVENEKDLGVWVTNKLDSSLHCQKAVAKANIVIGMIKRTFPSMSKDLFLFLYKTYVRPHLEYIVQLWSPYLLKDIDMLEKVQMRATKLIKGFNGLPYSTRLQKLELYSLYCRRERGDLIETYKILKGYYDIEWSKLFTLNTSNTRGHSLKLFKKQCRTKQRLNFFTQRVVNIWNLLPHHVVSTPTIALFKQQLDCYWKQQGHGYEQRPSA